MGASNVIMSTGAGAGAGAAVGGPWGALAGAAVGLAAGLFGEYEAAQNQREKERILEKASQQLNVSMDKLKTAADNYYNENQSVGRKEDISNYRNLVDGYKPYDFIYSDYDSDGDGINDSLKEFEYDKDVDDFYTPNREAIIQKTSDQLQSTAAGAGIGRGTGAANQIATGVANKNEELYKDALQAYNQDRQFAYQIWNSNIQNQQQRLDRLKAGLDTQLGLYGNLAQDYNNYQQQKAQTYMDLEKERMNNELQLTLASI